MRILLLLLFVLPIITNAQDTLILKSGEIIACSVKMTTSGMVQYSINGFYNNIDTEDLKSVIIHSPLINKEGNVSVFADGKGSIYKKDTVFNILPDSIPPAERNVR